MDLYSINSDTLNPVELNSFRKEREIQQSNENKILSTSFLLELKGIESVVEKQSVTVE